MKIRTAAFMAALSVACLAAHASSPGSAPELIQRFHCMGCHAVDKATIGPSFQQIAGNWRGKPGAEQALASTIRRGSEATGGPHWGQVKMPDDAEREQIGEKQARRIARWILRQQP
jgi:cytochrome c